MLKKGKKTHQLPSSKTKADEEKKIGQDFILFFIFLGLQVQRTGVLGLVGRQQYWCK